MLFRKSPMKTFPNDIDYYYTEKIRNWVNEYLPAKNYIWSLNGASHSDGFETWESFSTPHKKYDYVLNDKLNGFITQIRNHVNNQQRVLRLTGLSGLGKSRLVMEAFNPNLGIEAKALCSVKLESLMKWLQKYICVVCVPVKQP
jgi:hypothetical protein